MRQHAMLLRVTLMGSFMLVAIAGARYRWAA